MASFLSTELLNRCIGGAVIWEALQIDLVANFVVRWLFYRWIRELCLSLEELKLVVVESMQLVPVSWSVHNLVSNLLSVRNFLSYKLTLTTSMCRLTDGRSTLRLQALIEARVAGGVVFVSLQCVALISKTNSSIHLQVGCLTLLVHQKLLLHALLQKGQESILKVGEGSIKFSLTYWLCALMTNCTLCLAFCFKHVSFYWNLTFFWWVNWLCFLNLITTLDSEQVRSLI